MRTVVNCPMNSLDVSLPDEEVVECNAFHKNVGVKSAHVKALEYIFSQVIVEQPLKKYLRDLSLFT